MFIPILAVVRLATRSVMFSINPRTARSIGTSLENATSITASLQKSTAALSLGLVPPLSLPTVTLITRVLSLHSSSTWNSTALPRTNNVFSPASVLTSQSIQNKYVSVLMGSPTAMTSSSHYHVQSTPSWGVPLQAATKPATTLTSPSASLVLSPRPAISYNSSFSTSSTTPQNLLYTQIDSSSHTSVFTIPITTTITPPAGFSALNASNSQWTGDTTTTFNGSAVPVLSTGNHEGLILVGLGVRASGGGSTDRKRPGCDFGGLLVILKLIVPCGAQLKIPGLDGTILFTPKGIPVWEKPPTGAPPAYIDDEPPVNSEEQLPRYSPPGSDPNDDNDDQRSSDANQMTDSKNEKVTTSKPLQNSVTASLNHSPTSSSAFSSTRRIATYSTYSSTASSMNQTTSSAFLTMSSSASALTSRIASSIAPNGRSLTSSSIHQTVTRSFTSSSMNETATRTSASFSSSGTLADWIVYVRPTADAAEVQTIKNAIVSVAGAQNVGEISFDNNPGMAAFAVASLSNASAEMLNRTQPVNLSIESHQVRLGER